jgi:hypothetical protein
VAEFRNGSVVYRRAEEQPPDPRNRSSRLIERHLSTGDLEVRGTSSVGGVVTVLVVGEGAPEWLDARNYSVEAMFDQNGLVRRMTVSYERPEDARVRMRWRYRQLELGEFEPPNWCEQEFAT